MAEQTLQDVQPQVPDQPVAQVLEAQVQPQSLPEPIPAQPPPEEQSHQTEAQPEPITNQADTLMSEAAVCQPITFIVQNNNRLTYHPQAITYPATAKTIVHNATPFHSEPKLQRRR